MSDDNQVTLEIDGESVTARKGQMLIEVTDAAGKYVPRFCYHEKLSIAANCRMCLVEVERAPKPLPACATPVADGMKVSTRSAYAISAQRATMEFLLINHPLDCPICDQGGECELQDLAMGYGRDVSRYTEKKRVVKDKNIGPLVSTDMTRCIHCTRCVRFGKEVQGIQELGTTGRGENMEIGTYIERNIDHEMSANIIDLCPVGALNNKPYRYSARAWEMVQAPAVGAHDCVGSNLFVHALRGRIKRVVPRSNEAINETWISDRDRFSYEGIYSADRVQEPLVRRDGQLRPVSWEEALDAARSALAGQQPADVGFLVSPTATLEEGWLLSRIADGLGSANIDYRLGQSDTSGDDHEPIEPGLGMGIDDLATRDGVLLVGARLREEAPILAHRVRQAVLAGASVASIDATPTEYLFDRTAAIVDDPFGALSEVLRALRANATEGPAATIAAALQAAERPVIVLGAAARSHSAYAGLRGVAQALADATGAVLADVTAGPNAAGLARAGVLPHRAAGGSARETRGLAVAQMLAKPPATVLLWGIDAASDLAAAHPSADEALRRAERVIVCAPYCDAATQELADVVLPIGTFAETAGTYVNAAGTAQSWQGMATPVGAARPGWKVLRVLADVLAIPDLAFHSADEVREAAEAAIASASPVTVAAPPEPDGAPVAAVPPCFERNIYDSDAVVRRAHALQHTPAAGHRNEEDVAPAEQIA